MKQEEDNKKQEEDNKKQEGNNKERRNRRIIKVIILLAIAIIISLLRWCGCPQKKADEESSAREESGAMLEESGMVSEDGSGDEKSSEQIVAEESKTVESTEEMSSTTSVEDSTSGESTEKTDGSISPTTSSESSSSSNQTRPSDPTGASKPTVPSKPTSPVKPTDPSKPTNPAKPTDPSKPTNPVKPTDPSKPTDPEKQDPVYTVPKGLTAVYGQKVSEIKLPTGWSWEKGSEKVGKVGKRYHLATFTPKDTTRFNVVKGIKVEIIVVKADPSYTIPTGLTATFKDKLSVIQAQLGSGWTLVESLTNEVGNAGPQTVKAKFTPPDPANYNTVIVDVPINVKKKSVDESGIEYGNKSFPYNPNRTNSLSVNFKNGMPEGIVDYYFIGNNRKNEGNWVVRLVFVVDPNYEEVASREAIMSIWDNPSSPGNSELIRPEAPDDDNPSNPPIITPDEEEEENPSNPPILKPDGEGSDNPNNPPLITPTTMDASEEETEEEIKQPPILKPEDSTEEMEEEIEQAPILRPTA